MDRLYILNNPGSGNSAYVPLHCAKDLHRAMVRIVVDGEIEHCSILALFTKPLYDIRVTLNKNTLFNQIDRNLLIEEVLDELYRLEGVDRNRFYSRIVRIHDKEFNQGVTQ